MLSDVSLDRGPVDNTPVAARPTQRVRQGDSPFSPEPTPVRYTAVDIMNIRQELKEKFPDLATRIDFASDDQVIADYVTSKSM